MSGSGIGGKGGVAGEPRVVGSPLPHQRGSSAGVMPYSAGYQPPMPETPSHVEYRPSSTGVMRQGLKPNPAAYQPPMPETPSPAAYQPLAPQGDFNANSAAAGGLQQAMYGTQAAMAGPNVGAFMNPYTSMVTGNALNDLERQRQMSANTTSAQASQAGAFGGSRHGVADSLTNEAFARQGSQMFSNLQQQGYTDALNSAQNQQNIQMSGAAQMGQLGNQAFNTGRTISQDQMVQGLLQQGLQQSLIDAAKGEFNQYEGAPMASIGPSLAAMGSTPNQSTTTGTTNPGLFDYLSLVATAGASAAGGK